MYPTVPWSSHPYYLPLSLRPNDEPAAPLFPHAGQELPSLSSLQLPFPSVIAPIGFDSQPPADAPSLHSPLALSSVLCVESDRASPLPPSLRQRAGLTATLAPHISPIERTQDPLSARPDVGSSPALRPIRPSTQFSPSPYPQEAASNNRKKKYIYLAKLFHGRTTCMNTGTATPKPDWMKVETWQSIQTREQEDSLVTISVEGAVLVMKVYGEFEKWVYRQVLRPNSNAEPTVPYIYHFWSECQSIGFVAKNSTQPDTIVRRINVCSSLNPMNLPVIESFRKIIRAYDPTNSKKTRDDLSILFNNAAKQIKINFISLSRENLARIKECAKNKISPASSSSKVTSEDSPEGPTSHAPIQTDHNQLGSPPSTLPSVTIQSPWLEPVEEAIPTSLPDSQATALSASSVQGPIDRLSSPRRQSAAAAASAVSSTAQSAAHFTDTAAL